MERVRTLESESSAKMEREELLLALPPSPSPSTLLFQCPASLLPSATISAPILASACPSLRRTRVIGALLLSPSFTRCHLSVASFLFFLFSDPNRGLSGWLFHARRPHDQPQDRRQLSPSSSLSLSPTHRSSCALLSLTVCHHSACSAIVTAKERKRERDSSRCVRDQAPPFKRQ